MYTGRITAELELEETPPLQPIQEEDLLPKDKSKTGFPGVHQVDEHYLARCDTAPCRGNSLGTCFGTAEEASFEYLKHQKERHAPAGKPFGAEKLRLSTDKDLWSRQGQIDFTSPRLG